MEMYQKLSYLVGTLVKRSSAKCFSSDRRRTERQSGKEALKKVGKP